MDQFLLLASIFLVAGIIAVPIATRLGLGSVLGYLLAGIVISPLLSTLHADVISIQHFAEFGVVMMLFLVGMDLEPKRLWQMRARLLGLGGLQLLGTTGAVIAIALALGYQHSVALTIGLILALSSTAIVLQTLNEKGLFRSDGGQGSFAVLLFQDIAVIFILALLPLLALPELVEAAQTAEPHGAAGAHGPSLNLVEDLTTWQQVGVTISAIVAVILGGHYLMRPVFRFIAWANLRELFSAAALFIVIGIALLMTMVGLSPALGTFLAGVVLANSEYRHELESTIDPFRGLLLGLFFMTVGAGINFQLLQDHALTILGMTFGLMLLKAAVLLMLAPLFGIRGSNRWLLALGLAQAGEFGFVLLSFAVTNHVLPEDLADQLLLVVALSMLLSPALFILYDKIIARQDTTSPTKEADAIDEKGRAIIAGVGRVGGVVNRMLRGAGYDTVVLDYSSEHLEVLRTFGIKVFYGDATRPDLLHAAGIEEAEVMVIAINERERITELTKYVVENFPHIHVIARARDRHHVYELYATGCRDIVRDTFDSSVRMGRSAYEALGLHPFDAEQLSRQFAEDDKESMREVAPYYDPSIPAHRNDAYVAKTKELVEAREERMQKGQGPFSSAVNRDWSTPTKEDIETEEGATQNK